MASTNIRIGTTPPTIRKVYGLRVAPASQRLSRFAMRNLKKNAKEPKVAVFSSVLLVNLINLPLIVSKASMVGISCT